MKYLEITPQVTTALGFYNDVPDEKIEITLLEWKKKEGEEIGGQKNPHTGAVAGDWIVEFNSEKGKISLFAMEDWLDTRIVKILMHEGEVQSINFRHESLRLAVIEPVGGERQKKAEANQHPEESTVTPDNNADDKTPQTIPIAEAVVATSSFDNGNKGYASPYARRLAKKLGVEILKVQGTGVRGIVTPRDVEEAEHTIPAAPTTPQESTGRDELPLIEDLSYEIVIPSKLRRATAREMKRSRESTVVAGGDIEIDPQPLLAFIEKQRAVFARMHSGIKLRIDHFISVACTSLLREEEFCNLNAYWDEKTEKIRRYKQVNMGIAVSAPPNAEDPSSNLIVPKVKHAESLRFPDFVKEAERVISAAKTGSPHLVDVIGVTFVVDNAGIPVEWRGKFYPGIDRPSPVIMSRTGAILAFGRWREKNGGDGMSMWLILRIDHQLADGILASRFLRALEERLVNPEQIFLL